NRNALAKRVSAKNGRANARVPKGQPPNTGPRTLFVCIYTPSLTSNLRDAPSWCEPPGLHSISTSRELVHKGKPGGLPHERESSPKHQAHERHPVGQTVPAIRTH